MDSVERLVEALFEPNDVPNLQKGGNLRPVVKIAAARIVGGYSQLINDLGIEHAIVVRIQEAARKAKIEDSHVPIQGAVRYHTVLKSWSKSIDAAFKANNEQSQSLSKDTSINTELMQKMNQRMEQRMERLEVAVSNRNDHDNKMQDLLEQNAIQAAKIIKYETKIEDQEKKIKDQEREIQRLKRSMQAMISVKDSPVSHRSTLSPVQHPEMPASLPIHSEVPDTEAPSEVPQTEAPSEVPQTEATSSVAPPPVHTVAFVPDTSGLQSVEALTEEPSSKRQKVASDIPTTQLDGVQRPEAVGVGKITIVDEFERLTNQSIITERYKQLKSEEELSKRVLFDNSQPLFVGEHPTFKLKSEGAKYRGAMTIIALSMTDDHWKKLCDGSIEGLEERNLLQAIQKDAMNYALQLEVELEIKTTQQASKARNEPTLHSLGTRYNAIKKQWEGINSRRNFGSDFIDQKLGGSSAKQTAIGDFFGSRVEKS